MRFLVLALAVLLGGGAWAQSVWRISDSVGHDFGPSGSSDQRKGWFLRIEPRAGGEKRTLVHDGLEDSVRLVDLDAGLVVRVKELRGGQAVWETAYDPPTGLPVAETSFHDNEAVETAVLEYDNRTLVRRTVRDGQGALLYTDVLSHWPDGSLRRLERDTADGPAADLAWSYTGPRVLAGAWSSAGDDRVKGLHREWLYSPGKTEEDLVSGTGPVMTRVVERLESGGSRDVRTDLTSSRIEKRLLDSQGRTIDEVVSVKGEVTGAEHWSYDSKGRILESTADSVRGREGWSYIYRDDGTTLASQTRDGVKVREETLRNGERLSVSLYDRGNLFLVETWSGGKKVKETYYRNGVIQRERIP